jgi:hypothetical protein
MEYTKVVLEGDARGRASISALDADGAGHGYRLAGPKYIGDIVNGVTTAKTFEVELDDRDVDEVHSYLRIWDEIHVGDEPPEWAKLIEASDRYRRVTTDLARCRTYPNFPAERLVEIEKLRDQARRRLAETALGLAAALDGASQ